VALPLLGTQVEGRKGHDIPERDRVLQTTVDRLETAEPIKGPRYMDEAWSALVHRAGSGTARCAPTTDRRDEG